MKHLSILLLISFSLLASINAQELNCNVTINSDQIAGTGTNKSVFTSLTKSVTDFMNNRKWTEMNFANQERIECSIAIILTQVSDDKFTGEIQVQSRRPVYNSGYKTTLLNFKDPKFVFKYKEFDQLEMVNNSVTSNLTAALAFYAYLIIGYDLDSFSRLGGTSVFQQAESIANSAASIEGANEDGGWTADFKNTKNRYALINNILDEAFSKYRNYFYEYHRLGLDEMTVSSDNARERIFTGLPILRDANRSRPSAVVITNFFNAKNDELINIFSKASTQEKQDVVEILSDVNPTQSSKYEQILKSN
jgi:Domain of unknown function (DUF4835)